MNPWSDSQGSGLGGYEGESGAIMSLQIFGLIQTPNTDSQSHSAFNRLYPSSNSNSSTSTSSSSPSSSKELIETLKNYSKLIDSWSSLKKSLELIESISQNIDLTSASILGSKSSSIDNISSNLKSINSNVSYLSAYLQNPFTGNFIVIHRDAQWHLHELCLQMSSSLSALTRILESLSHGSSFSINDTLLQSLSTTSASTLASLHIYHTTLNSLRITLSSLIE